MLANVILWKSMPDCSGLILMTWVGFLLLGSFIHFGFFIHAQTSIRSFPTRLTELWRWEAREVKVEGVEFSNVCYKYNNNYYKLCTSFWMSNQIFFSRVNENKPLVPKTTLILITTG